MAYTLNTFGDIKTAILGRIKANATDTNTVDRISEMINTRYQDITKQKKWTFTRSSNRMLKIPAKVTTGTVTFTEGSRIVTGVGTAFSDLHVGWQITPNAGPSSYLVVAVESDTELVLATEYTDSTASNTEYILFANKIPLFPDLLEIETIRVDNSYTIKEPVGPIQIEEMCQRQPFFQGCFKYFTLDGTNTFFGAKLGEFVLGYDFLGKTPTICMSIYPQVSDKNYSCHISYKINVPALEQDDDKPVIPLPDRNIILFGVLADWYMTNGNAQTGSYYDQKYKEKLAEMESKYVITDNRLTLVPRSVRQYYVDMNGYFSSQAFDRG